MDFYERLNTEILICDGAMGTMLYEKGVPLEHCYDELNISSPEIVKEVHLSYIKAGADIIETNTFGANEYILSRYYDLGKKSYEINYRGAKIAKEVAKDRVFVAGAVGPISRIWEIYEKLSKEEIKTIFKKQIQALVEGGVDLIIIETIPSVKEAILAYTSAKEITSLPIICQLTFGKTKTLKGEEMVEVVTELNKLGVEIMGANCGTGPTDMYQIIKRMSVLTTAYLSTQPNAGLPSFHGGKFTYPATSQYFAEYGKKFVEIGVQIVGGCCGTTPLHIKTMKEKIKHLKPGKRKFIQVEKIEKKLTIPSKKEESKLWGKFTKKEFIISTEITPPRGTNIKKEIEFIKKFEKLGGNCINVTDNPMAKLRMSAISLAYAIKNISPIEIILHYTCRDKNLLAIQSELLGIYTLGIKNILALTGDPPSIGDYPFASAVYEVTSVELIEIISLLNQSKDWLLNPLKDGTSLLIGCGGSLKDVERVKQKIKKGAKFIQTQPIFEIKEVKQLKSIFPEIPLIVSILILFNSRHTLFMKNEVPGINIPDEIVKRMEKEKCGCEGVEIAREIIEEVKNMCEGICLIPPFRKYELVLKILT
jgi:homocysteine S-methyltransferase